MLTFLSLRIALFAALNFSSRLAIDGLAYGLSHDLMMAAMKITLFSTLAYGAVRSVVAWVNTD